jgi:lipopolysaccharide biosynthesis protein
MNDNKNYLRFIAFYLPQFHPIPENDAWWGKGFTEWTNVAKAKPLFRGHYQPHLPADLGFYDLRVAEVREAQADLARKYGLHGFCYYHYWFSGKRLLERPFNEVLISGKPDFPFCLCWANENWTRRWDGKDEEILAEQKYDEEDDKRHMQWLAGAFEDKRYIRVSGKPIFLVYRASSLPNPVRTVSIWRREARRHGIGEIYLCKVESFTDERCDPREIGFDAAVEFQPDWVNLGTLMRRNRFWTWATRLGLADKSYQTNHIYDYASVVETMTKKDAPSYIRFPCVTPSWDNSPRRKSKALIIKGSTPELYGKWLETVMQKVEIRNPDENLVFINAWNEWGEGNHLEPDQKWGRAYLEITRKILLSKNTEVGK